AAETDDHVVGVGEFARYDLGSGFVAPAEDHRNCSSGPGTADDPYRTGFRTHTRSLLGTGRTVIWPESQRRIGNFERVFDLCDYNLKARCHPGKQQVVRIWRGDYSRVGDHVLADVGRFANL